MTGWVMLRAKRRRWSEGRGRVLVLLLVALVVVLGSVQASAAKVTVSTAKLGAFKAAPCTTATVAVTHGSIDATDQKTASVVVTVPAACAGLPLALRLYRVNGTPLHTVDLTAVSASSPTTTIVLATADRYIPAEVTGVALTLGTWGMRTTWTYTPPAGPGTCEIVSSTAPYAPITPAPRCAVTSLTYTDFNDGHPPGSRNGNVYFTLSTTVGSNQLIKVSLNLPAAANIPSDWNFATSAVGARGNVSPYPGFTCAAMASGVFVALSPAWTASGGNVYLGQLVEDRSESGNYACTP